MPSKRNPQRLDHAHRRRIRVVSRRHDAADLCPVEQRVDHRRDRFRGEPAVLRRWRDRVSERGTPGRRLGADGEIADHLALVVDRHLRPALRIEIVAVRLAREQSLGVRQPERQRPVLEAGDLGIVAVCGKHRCVATLHEAQREALGADREDRHHASETDGAEPHSGGASTIGKERCRRVEIAVDAAADLVNGT